MVVTHDVRRNTLLVCGYGIVVLFIAPNFWGGMLKPTSPPQKSERCIEIKGIRSSSVKHCFLSKILLEVFFTDFLCQNSCALQA